MTNKERIDLGHWVATQCRKAGADDATVNISYNRAVEIKHQNRQIDQLKESTQNSLNLNVFWEGRFSGHSTNDLRRDALASFAEEAVAMTKYLSADPDRSITDPRYYEGLQNIDLKIIDADYDELTSEERVRYARECEEEALALSDKIVTCSGNTYDTLYESVKVHSNGFEGRSRGTYFQAYAEVTAHGEGDALVNDYEVTASCFHKDLMTPEEVAKTAVERTMAKAGQAKMESGVYDMIVENRAMSKLIRGMLGPLSGQSIHRKNSFLIDKIGEKIGSEKLTITDDPFLKSGLGSRLYDGDGIPCRKRVIIDKGVLKTYFINWFYSRKLKMEPTTGGRSNVVYEYGTKSLEELVAQASRAILVTSFIGGNSNSTTGEFSYGMAGHYVEDGKIVKPLFEMNVSGSYVDLWNQLLEVGNDPYLRSSNRRPSMYFKEMQFAGK